LERSDKDLRVKGEPDHAASPPYQELDTVARANLNSGFGAKRQGLWVEGEPDHAASPLYQELDTVSMSEALRRFWSTATGIKE
jgi:hypothetical protein